MASNGRCQGSFAWGRWISLYCALSFLALGTDAAMNHHKVLETNPLSWTPVGFAPIAAVLCLGAFVSARWRRAAWLVGLLGLLVGGVGTMLHGYFDFTDGAGLTPLQVLLNASRPPMAPGAFASSGILMLLVALAERWPLRRKIADS